MFMRKAFRKRKAAPKATKTLKAGQSKCKASEKANKRLEAGGDSLESSDVEYIEDENGSPRMEAVPKPRISSKEAVAVPKIKVSKEIEIEDALLSLSVAIPSENNQLDLDDDSCYSQNGVVTKLPPYLVDKSRYQGALNIESRPSMSVSITSEDHGTQVTASMSEQTLSESGSTISAYQEMMHNRERKVLATWISQMDASSP